MFQLSNNGKRDKMKYQEKKQKPKPKQSKTKKNIVSIHSAKYVGIQTYNVKNEFCGICRNLLTMNCITCDNELQSDTNCNPSFGTCGHAFHFHCIHRWLKSCPKMTCPICVIEWNFKNN